MNLRMVALAFLIACILSALCAGICLLAVVAIFGSATALNISAGIALFWGSVGALGAVMLVRRFERGRTRL